MHVDQSGEIVCQGVGGRGGHKPRLAHAATEEFPEVARFLDEFLGADEARADGRAYWDTGCGHAINEQRKKEDIDSRNGIDIPSPLLKHKLTESKGSHSSLIETPVSAETCHIRAPSRCMSTPSECAHSEMRMTSSCGMIVPFSVFSSSTICVGALQSGRASE